MKAKLTLLSIADLSFLLILALAGGVGGVPGILLRCAAWILPCSLSLMWLHRRERTEKNVSKSFPMLSPGTGLSLILPLFPLLLALNLGVANLTGVFFRLFGLPLPTMSAAAPLWESLLLSALLPAVGEELLFRYLPLRALSGESGRAAVLWSALLFAAVHGNFYQFPYAFLSGVMFAVLDLYAGSLLPSFLFHLGNNAVSVFLTATGGRFGDAVTGRVFLPVLAVTCGLSLVYIVLRRTSYLSFFTYEKREKRKYIFAISPFVVLAVGVTMAILHLLSGGAT